RIRMTSPTINELSVSDPKIYRFFLDGLIAHVGRKSMDFRLANRSGRRPVGSENLLVLGRPYEGSRQERTMVSLQDELDREWPEKSKRIFEALSATPDRIQ